MLALLAVGCSVRAPAHPCNIAVTAPLIAIELHAYASMHRPVSATLCLTGDYSGARPSCTSYTVNANGTAQRIGASGGYAPVRPGGLEHSAPTGGVTVSLTVNSASGQLVHTAVHLAGRPGYCGAWRYPTLTLTGKGQLSA